MKRNAIAIGLGAGLTLFIASIWRAERRRRLSPPAGERKAPLEPVQTWEGEGGNLAGIAPPPAPQEAGQRRQTH
ncbi:hypothetical protein [Chitinimonas sp.]|uniref:hypothetical protein n=1 Tax=Chitinimonas sp. TaxID=1934313 RepID=UPI002F93A2DC